MAEKQTAEILIAKLVARMSQFWCNWVHGGGRIVRDELGQINWRCSKCGRWGMHHDFERPTE
jgi:hypothetical protein